MRVFGVLLLGLAAVGLTACGGGDGEKPESFVRAEAWDDETLELAATIPVMQHGRVKPLGTYAGFLMLRLNIPAAPFLIAFILGPLLEDNFRQSLLLSKGDYGIFFASPICWIFWVLTCIAVALTVWRGIGPRTAS